MRQLELRLLRTTLPANITAATSPSSFSPLVQSVLSSIEEGNYADVAATSASQLPLDFAATWQFEDSTECAGRFFEELERRMRGFIEGLDGEVEERIEILLCVGVAAVLAFTQQNLTGPVGKFSPFPVPTGELPSTGGKWDLWAANQLSSVGSHIQSKLSLLQYFIYAKIIFTSIKDCFTKNNKIIGTLSLWLFRVYFLQQRILDELSSTLLNELELHKNEILSQFGNSEKVSGYFGNLLMDGEGSVIACMACLEAANFEYKYCFVDLAREHINYAKEECQLDISKTGVLGFRTIHQVDPKAQLVLLANTQDKNNSATEFKQNYDCAPHEEDESCEILRAPRLVQNEENNIKNDASLETNNNNNVLLNGIQQAVVIGECLHIKRAGRDDELSGWEKAPYIEFIDSQKQSYYAVKCLCDLLRVRWESDRGRTKQRALIMMENLVECVSKTDPDASERIRLAFGVYLPTIPALRKEYCELLISCGLVSEALKILEDLELWDNLIDCYRLLGKKAAAVDLIKARLIEKPNDPRLWCSFGDVTNTDAHYEKALEVSNNKSARAMRSLARSSYNRDDFKTAKKLWESALALNSLYPDGWFSFGAAAWKDQDLDRAVDAFTRAVQIDPENGEAWNNIGCLHMKRNKSVAACAAFKEAVKYKRNSWEVWENYSKVSFDSGNLRRAVEAVKMVIQLSNNKRVDVLILDRIMSKLDNLSRNNKTCEANNNIININTDESESGSNNNTMDKRVFDFLLDSIGNILQEVIKSNPGEGIWGLYAKWHKIKGDLAMCAEALLKQLRSLQGSELWHHEKKFKKFANTSLQLCSVYMEISSSTGSRRELSSAQMHLKSTLKQAVDFTETEEFKELNNCLDEIKKRLESAST